jgi:uncharacterized protein (DUF362 family)
MSDLDPNLTRRQFVRTSAAALALASCGSHGRRAEAEEVPSLGYDGTRATPVALAGVASGTGDDATVAAVRAAALAATDFSWLSRGDSVLIKPVCNSGNVYPATTDPVALRAMIALLRERGAGRIVVADMSGVEFVRFSPDRLHGSTRELMRRNGMAQAVEAAGAELHAFEEQGWDAFFDEKPAAGPNWRHPLLMPRILQEVDHVVLMPRCARHVLAGSTLGMKAAVGWWRHDARLEYHHDAATLAQKTAEANTVPSLTGKQRLVLTSATKVLTTFGPDQGFVATPPTGLVFASTSLAAHDMTSLAFLLDNRAAMPAADREGVIDDPNTSGAFVNFANRIVVNWLGGIGKAFSAERLARYDYRSIWDDRVLRRAFEIGGGVPRIEFAAEGGSVPDELRRRLQTHVTLPA